MIRALYKCTTLLLLLLFNYAFCVRFFFVQMFNLYIKQAAEIFGVTHTREIYEKAIEVLLDDQAR